MRVGRAAVVAGAIVTAVLVLSGCTSSDGLASKYGNGQGYVSGDGTYLELPVADRDEPVVFSGPSSHGDELDSADYLGRITVVNFWYAGCPPCRLEAADLVELSAELSDVAFIGVNVYDTVEVANAFEREFGIEYPSILDVVSNSVQRAFAGRRAPNAVPTTLVLDTEGRVAARISGLIRDPANLVAMIERVQEEG